jgi:hypothetical protein
MGKSHLRGVCLLQVPIAVLISIPRFSGLSLRTSLSRAWDRVQTLNTGQSHHIEVKVTQHFRDLAPHGLHALGKVLVTIAVGFRKKGQVDETISYTKSLQPNGAVIMGPTTSVQRRVLSQVTVGHGTIPKTTPLGPWK